MRKLVRYWTQHSPVKNFGDYLTEIFLERLVIAPLCKADVYRFIGSAIDDHILAQDVVITDVDDPVIALWQCGARASRALDESIIKHCHFFGVRGPLTRDVLGLPLSTPLGDPAFLLPLIHAPRTVLSVTGKAICVPHISDTRKDPVIEAETGADLVVRPTASTLDELIALLDAITTADFVLAGAMHAAIIACAYGKPFAFYDGGGVDVPFKWADFSALVKLTPSFVRTVSVGRSQWNTWSKGIELPKLMPMLLCCPWAVRPSVLALARKVDAGARVVVAEDPDPLHVELEEKLIEAARQSTSNSLPSRPSESAKISQAMRIGLRELQGTALKLEGLLKAVSFSFFEVDGEATALTFAQGAPGAEYLLNGWSPSSEIGPWAIERMADILLPEFTHWYRGVTMVIEGFAFAPNVPPCLGARQVDVWLEDTQVATLAVKNSSADNSVFVSIDCRVPPSLSERRGPLSVRFTFDSLHSPQELGIGSDRRRIAFAITAMRFCLDPRAC